MAQNQDNPKGSLSARFAARLERSYFRFRWTLSLLEPEEYTQPCLPNGWTPLATVAHIAWWDDFQRRRMAAAVRGDGPIPPPAESNDERAANESRAWNVVVAEADAARERLIRFALSLADAQIRAEYGERPLALQLLTHMPRHVEEHTAEVRRYCISLERWGQDGFLHFYRCQFDSFLDAITGLREESCMTIPVCGDWSVRDLLAHVLVWDEYVWETIRRWPEIDRAALARWSDPGADGDATNARLLATKAEFSMIDLLDGLTTLHWRIVSRFLRLTDEQLRTEVECGWDGKETPIGFLHSMSAHRAEHAAAIYAARADGRLVPLAAKSQPECA